MFWRRPIIRVAIFLLLFVTAGTAQLSAAVALLVGEPYGKFGFFNPTGHSAIYLSGICAETPTILRLCSPGEPGTVISRYGNVAGLDWIAIPPLPYFYAVEQPEYIPLKADKKLVANLRESYRRERLRELIPDDPRRETPKGDWVQLVGSAYDRNIYGFSFETTPEEDERLVQYLNELRNQRRFNLFWRNCADFAREILNFYQPGAVRRNIIGDFGITTPKQVARSLVKYSQKQPQLRLTHFVVPQVPGGRASTRIRGVSESLLQSKKYVIPLIIVQPWVAASAAVAYLTSGRFNPSHYDPAHCETADLTTCMTEGNRSPLVRNNHFELMESDQWMGASLMESESIGIVERAEF